MSNMAKAAQGFLSEAYFEYLLKVKTRGERGPRKKFPFYSRELWGGEDDDDAAFFEEHQVVRSTF